MYGGRNLIALDPTELRRLRGADISMIFQEPMTSLNPVFTVGFQLTEVLRLHLGLSPSDARKRALALLAEVGIPDPEFKINAYPSQMSGGQQQRVMIAMAIACEPKLLIADEPTTALDVTIQKQILDLIRDLQKQPPDVGAVHHPRSRGGGRNRRLRRGHAQRRDSRTGSGQVGVRESAGRVHQGAACCAGRVWTGDRSACR